MTHELFRVTVDEPNYSKTLGKPLSDDLKSFLPKEERTVSEQRVWAINVDSPAANTYDKFMKTGGGLIFYKVTRGLAANEKMYVGTGKIGTKFEVSADVARRLFGTPSAQLVFSVENFNEIAKTVEELEPMLGYKQHPQRTQRVKPERYQSVESVLSQLHQ